MSASFSTLRTSLKDAVKRKKNSPISAITGGSEGDWEEFQALEKLKEQRKELESLGVDYMDHPAHGTAGYLWQADARKR